MSPDLVSLARWVTTVAAIAVSGSLVAPRALGADELCGNCSTTGRVKNERAASLQEIEKGCLLCSVAIENDSAGLGLDWLPCPGCKATKLKEAAQKEWDELAATRRDWLKKQCEWDKIVGSPLMHCETAHFTITFHIPKIVIGKQVIDEHKGMHLYAKRAEELRSQIMELHGITEAHVYGEVKHEIAMFERERDARALSPHLTNRDLSGGAKSFKIGPKKSATVSWDDPRIVQNDQDEDRHQLFVHMVAHHIYHDIKEYDWWLYDKHGWVFEGTSDVWECRLFGSPRVSCQQEQMGAGIRTAHTFESTVKKAVVAGNATSLANIIERNLSSLSMLDRQCAWSYVDFLIWYDPHAFRVMLTRLLENRVPTRDAIREAYGMSFPQVQEQWEDFVRTNYSTKDRKGPLVHPPRKAEAGKR